MRFATGIFILAFVAGCSDPKYVSEPSAPPADTKLTADCEIRFQRSGLCLAFKWEQTATESQPAVLIARLYRPAELDAFPVLQDVTEELRAKISMPGMGHGAPPVHVSKLGAGTYRVSNMYFSIMHGDWEITFQLISESSAPDEAVVPYVF